MRRRTATRRPAKKAPLGPMQTYLVEGLTHEAKGVARLNGKVTFIEGALPGETVTAQVNKPGRRFDEAVLNAVIETSVDRVSPACQHFGDCGGCSFQHLEESAQRLAKADWLAGQLRNLLSKEQIECLFDVGSGYRRRARIAIDHKKNALVLGFRSKASNRVVDVEQCHVLTPSLQTLFVSLKVCLKQHPILSSLGHIELLEDTKGLSVVLRLVSNITPVQQQAYLDWAQQQDVELYWQAPKASRADLTDEQMRYYDVSNLRLKYHPQDFIQINEFMNQKMVAQAMAWLAPQKDDTVLDLFCGVGNFSLPLAQLAGSVIGVELQESMVQAGRHNASLNGLKNLSFVAADLTQPVAGQFSAENINKILLDPPRAGAFEFLDTIIHIAPQQILYVSCNASTLARDAEYLVLNGYKVVRAGLMDMFPQTSHVETMMLLQKQK
ncbi:23S rRNA (uracil(1939)-C(5))-methyltransferase RlmD [Marinomonas posidonica]|uniref:23S rRNA (uracil(1939)-C(5))-methyltransferase RlmD n=1 Tax=Marinomonas posidonica (strain CECT 7376 / NCIMB 14433 / IVIA-Po-181) TaxID=491952 RepID=RLMD_MARPP|nr:23S rRNA (uracil(1939)-C(5))-methyltransferase RlmD [Marinomonas posidonica]F6CY50.1 RecName: Full=23S rRNA (uracil(1939)-C(5))-methyltransferase RlmD; AltName: Full=23S rRNA(m5U1939)-methyltransferase [Marinomonas posidonica IVIA-Po-181]AEF55682.1 RNA methyltransferase, TrmA family [Marinomonas posidonica IVIA-Po-181]